MLIRNQKAFTLIEVIASVVIIFIILISFSMLFVQSNKTANYNIDKLVLINLADASLERVQALSFKTKEELIQFFNDNHTISFNEKDYDISYRETPNLNVSNLNLIHIEVTAKLNQTKSVAEGYVKIQSQQ